MDRVAKRPIDSRAITRLNARSLQLHRPTMIRIFINYFKALFELQAADPAQVAEIAELKAKLASTQTELTETLAALAKSRENDPTPDEQVELDEIIAKLAAQTPPPVA